MRTPPPPPTEVVSAPSPDKSRFKFQKLLHPFTLERGIATPIVWFLLDWLVLGVAIASLLVVESWWVKVFASLVSALWIARLFHLFMLVLLAALIFEFGLGKFAWIGLAAVFLLLAYEHSLVSKDDLSKLNAAFFTMNGIIAVVFWVFLAADLLLRRPRIQ